MNEWMNKFIGISIIILLLFLSCKGKNSADNALSENKNKKSVENILDNKFLETRSDEKLICTISFSEKEENSGIFFFESIVVSEKDGDVERFIPQNDGEYFILESKGDNKFILKNYSRIQMPKDDTDVVIIDDDTMLYTYQGEKGGGHTYIYIYFRKNKIEVRIDYVYINMSQFDESI